MLHIFFCLPLSLRREHAIFEVPSNMPEGRLSRVDTRHVSKAEYFSQMPGWNIIAKALDRTAECCVEFFIGNAKLNSKTADIVMPA